MATGNLDIETVISYLNSEEFNDDITAILNGE